MQPQNSSIKTSSITTANPLHSHTPLTLPPNPQIYTRPIGSRLFSYLHAAFSRQNSDEHVTPMSVSALDPHTPLRKFFTQVLDQTRSGFGDQGIVLASVQYP